MLLVLVLWDGDSMLGFWVMVFLCCVWMVGVLMRGLVVRVVEVMF